LKLNHSMGNFSCSPMAMLKKALLNQTTSSQVILMLTRSFKTRKSWKCLYKSYVICTWSFLLFCNHIVLSSLFFHLYVFYHLLYPYTKLYIYIYHKKWVFSFSHSLYSNWTWKPLFWDDDSTWWFVDLKLTVYQSTQILLIEAQT